MPRARAYSRSLYRERHKKQYTLTKTKLIVGFLISLFGSVFVGTYLERYGPIILEQAGTAIHTVFSDEGENSESPSQTTSVADSGTTNAKLEELNDLEGRVRKLRDLERNPSVDPENDGSSKSE